MLKTTKDIKLDDGRIVNFSIIPLVFKNKNMENIFSGKNNKTLGETLENGKYKKLVKLFGEKYKQYYNKKLGDFLRELKDSGDGNFLKFLNKYGDEKFCEFLIDENLSSKGIYCYIVDDEIKYIGRCNDNFKKRINQGYGKIYPKNCFIDGQATNCHLNSLINSEKEVKFGVCIMNDKTQEQINKLERDILVYNFKWNIQVSH